MRDKLEQVKTKEQFIIAEIGSTKLSETMNALDSLKEQTGLTPAQLQSVTEYYRLVNLLPIL